MWYVTIIENAFGIRKSGVRVCTWPFIGYNMALDQLFLPAQCQAPAGAQPVVSFFPLLIENWRSVLTCFSLPRLKATNLRIWVGRLANPWLWRTSNSVACGKEKSLFIYLVVYLFLVSSFSICCPELVTNSVSLEEGKERCWDLLQSRGFGFIFFLPLEPRPRPLCKKEVVKHSGGTQVCVCPGNAPPCLRHTFFPLLVPPSPPSFFLQRERESPLCSP